MLNQRLEDHASRTSMTENFLAHTHIRLYRQLRHITYIISGVLAASDCSYRSATRGLSYGVDFSGGRAFVVRFRPSRDRQRGARSIAARFRQVSSYEVKQFGKENQMRIVTQYKYDDAGDNVTAEIESMLYQSLSPLMTQKLTESEFQTTPDQSGTASSVPTRSARAWRTILR